MPIPEDHAKLQPEVLAMLYQQEHRLLHVINNWRRTRHLNPDDPHFDCKAAAGEAIIWRMLFSPTTIIIGGGILAVFTVLVTAWQTTIMQAANEELRAQTQLLQTQGHAGRTTDLLQLLYAPKVPPTLREQALKEILLIWEVENPDGDWDLRGAHLGDMLLMDLDLSKVRLFGADMKGAWGPRVTLDGDNLTDADCSRAEIRGTLISPIESCYVGRAVFRADEAIDSDRAQAIVSKVNELRPGLMLDPAEPAPSIDLFDHEVAEDLAVFVKAKTGVVPIATDSFYMERGVLPVPPRGYQAKYRLVFVQRQLEGPEAQAWRDEFPKDTHFWEFRLIREDVPE